MQYCMVLEDGPPLTSSGLEHPKVPCESGFRKPKDVACTPLYTICTYPAFHPAAVSRQY